MPLAPHESAPAVTTPNSTATTTTPTRAKKAIMLDDNVTGWGQENSHKKKHLENHDDHGERLPKNADPNP